MSNQDYKTEQPDHQADAAEIDHGEFTGTEAQLDYLARWFARQAARREKRAHAA